MEKKNEQVVPVITEEELQKSLATLEGKKDEPVVPAEPVVAIEPLKKTAAQTVAENGSEEMRKALDVSTILREHVGLVGIHVDATLEALHKSLQGAAERDFAIIRILEKQNMTIEELRKTIETYGKQPTAPAVERKVNTQPTDVLKKAADGEAPKISKEMVKAGLEKLAKTAGAGTQDFERWARVTAKFESTGQISDVDLLEASKASKA